MSVGEYYKDYYSYSKNKYRFAEFEYENKKM